MLGLHMDLVAAPLLISVALLMVGSAWLTLTDSFGGLILNAIALEFVICIYELLFGPASLHSRMDPRSQVLEAWCWEGIEQKRITFVQSHRRSFVYGGTTFFGV